MTVFGFGRYDFDAYLQNNGQQFVIGLVEDTDFAPVSSAINTASQPLSIEQGLLQFWQTAVSQTNPLTHTITGHTSVTAVFEAELYTIETNVDGQGSITTAPSQEFYLYGDEVVFTATAEDPNSTVPTLTAVDLPQGAEFVDKGDGTAVFDWTPSAADLGQYQITISANDGELSTEQTFTITVIPHQNWLPAIFN